MPDWLCSHSPLASFLLCLLVPAGGSARILHERLPVPLDRRRADIPARRPDARTDTYRRRRPTVLFTPSVAPFARYRAYDLIGADGALSVASKALQPVAVTPYVAGGLRYLFKARLPIACRAPCGPVPIPSPGPDMAVHRVGIPGVRFFRDGADNYYVVLGPSSPRTHVLEATVSVPSSYFRGPLPKGPPLATLPRPPVLPADLRALALRMARQMGVRPQDPFGGALTRLVAYHRAFRPGPLERSTGNIYLDLASSQRGVCRHRAYSFLVTALALGIRTRYVESRTHAFVEVQMPNGRWRRIDLGGALARPLPERVRRLAVGPDPFPWPGRRRRSATGRGLVVLREGRASMSRRRPRPLPATWFGLPATALRGEFVTFQGQSREGCPDHPFVVLRRGPSELRVLGAVRLDRQGRFRLRVRLPASVPAGTYEVVLMCGNLLTGAGEARPAGG